MFQIGNPLHRTANARRSALVIIASHNNPVERKLRALDITSAGRRFSASRSA